MKIKALEPSITRTAINLSSHDLIYETKNLPQTYYFKTKYQSKIYKELRCYEKRFRREFDETEAYLRHRERVREREKRDKLKKQGKLDEYLKSKGEEPKPKVVEEQPRVVDDPVYEQYKEMKKEFEFQFQLVNYSKFDVIEKKVEEVVKRIKVKKKLAKAKKARIEEDEFHIPDSEEFKPKMAGKTGLPSFFFSNVVKQTRSAFQKTDARNRMWFKSFAPK